jgi:serine/threonine-protein kinase
MSEQRMIGHYRIVELLGSGAMGKVHVAVDTFIEREVAIKSLRAELTRDPEFVGRFKAEAMSLARLNHPNITTLYSPLLDGEDLYMVMELVRGRALDDILGERKGPLGVRESLAIIAQAADGVSYAHQMGVIHRDIKPSNLMVGDDGRVKIMDFGIARVRGSVRLTRAGTAIGTPLYMAPEQRRGSEGDERSDLYSLAVVLYEMLSGAPPFAGLDEVDLLQAQINSEPPPLVPRIPGVGADLEAAIMTALAKKPEQRFPTVRAFSDAVGATALRVDATAIVQCPAHLLEASTQTVVAGGGASSLPSVAMAVAKSRSTGLMRRFKNMHPVGQGVSVAIVAFAAVAPFLFGSDDKRRPQEPEQVARLEQNSRPTIDVDYSSQKRSTRQVAEERDELRVQKADIGERPTPKNDCGNGLFSAGDCQPSSMPTPKTQPAFQPERVALAQPASFAEIRRAVEDGSIDKAERLAATSDPETQYQLGMLFYKSFKDERSAFRWFKKSADRDNSDAQTAVGIMYKDGLVDGRENLTEAVYWFERAAKQNNGKGQYWLGVAYERGAGGRARNYAEAERLYSSASTQNVPEAAEALRRLRQRRGR